MPSVSPQRIILADGNHLLHQMLRRVLEKAQDVEVVHEIHDLDTPDALEGLKADWVIMSLPFGRDLPQWADAYIASHPYVGLLIVSSDSDRIKIKWSETHEQQLHDVTLNDLMHILKGHPQEV